MATNNYEELTKKCQEIFDKLILENKEEIDQLNKKEVKKHQRTRSMAPPNSYGLYGSSRRQCDIECTLVRPRSNSVPATLLSGYNVKEVNNMNNNTMLSKFSIEPIQEEGEFKITNQRSNSGIVSTDPLLNAELRKISSKMDTHTRSKSLSFISEDDVLSIEDLINNQIEEQEKKQKKIITRNRSYSYSCGNSNIKKEPLSVDEYKKRVELEVYRQQIRCHEKIEFDNYERNKYQKFLKWQEVDFQNKKNSWNI
ncbi:hypothetical protein H8356DRAFT_1625804 [Neocallimastix lanati (nom. inval.)]|jgi:hypothetical protein|nr:hypothetical protein H8356DRAFT_1625804 [Neocallimastix sp. JGI-2020a]